MNKAEPQGSGWISDMREQAFLSSNMIVDDYKKRPTTIPQIKKMISDFIRLNPATDDVEINFNISGRSISSAASVPTLYSRIVQALKTLEIVIGTDTKQVVDFSKHGTHPIDSIIYTELFAIREGVRICWDIKEGRVYYDPISNKLSLAST